MEHFSRISLDTAYNWQDVKAKVREAAMARLQERLNENGKGNEELLKLRMEKFLNQTFTMALPNLRVNGLNMEELGDTDQATEPFDEALDRHIWSLSNQKLRWDIENAKRRRDAPTQVQNKFETLAKKQSGMDSSMLDSSADDDDDDDDDDIPIDEDEVNTEAQKQTFEEMLANARELRQSMPIQTARAQRIAVVRKEIRRIEN